MTDPNLAIDRLQLAASFSAAANDYDALARIQYQAGCDLLQWAHSIDGFAESSAKEGLLLDLGCGTGQLNRQLQRCWSQADILGLDLAHGMLQQARQGHHAGENSWLCADAENLPLADESVDWIFSNFALQWCDLEKVLAEAQRVLKPGGQMLFTTLLDGTLSELKSAWKQADQKINADSIETPHVNHFSDQQNVERILQQFYGRRITCQGYHTEYFADVFALMKSIKGIGARNLNPQRSHGLTGRKRIMAMQSAYEEQRCSQGLPLSWNILKIYLAK